MAFAYGERLREIMLSNGWTMAAGESVTCGNIQRLIGEISGASDFFAGGVTAYNLRQKSHILGVDRPHAQDVNCVSQRVAEEMAKGTAKLFGASLAVSSTGYAEPYPALGVEIPCGHLALWQRDGNGDGRLLYHERVEAPGLDRTQVQIHLAEAILSAVVGHFSEGD